jgi:hypothetical protein
LGLFWLLMTSLQDIHYSPGVMADSPQSARPMNLRTVLHTVAADT